MSLLRHKRLFEAACDIRTPALPLLYRYFLIRFSPPTSFINEKLAVAKDNDDHWFLRTAAIGALAPIRANDVSAAMKELCNNPITAIKRAAQQAYPRKRYRL